ncbi:bifunctional nuclease family protein [Streptomyces sp. NPDC059009]|uniref:bifunctional nuclease family protein n=1 Tax=Streptomyces sp. NPDC059009 TaxID=3346694 RepID=UPI0036D1507F
MQPQEPTAAPTGDPQATAALGLPWSEVEVVGVRVEPSSNQPIVLLHDRGRAERYLPISINPAGATEIALLAPEHEPAAAPPGSQGTHALMQRVLDTYAISIERVVIHGVSDRVYGAAIRFTSRGNSRDVTAMCADAIALALRFGAPLTVGVSLLEEAGLIVPDEEPTA